MKRVTWIRVDVNSSGASAVAFGVSFRRPAAFRITLGDAASLACRGVPLLVRRSGA